MHDMMAGHVRRGEVPGLVTLICRRGEVFVDAVGERSPGEPMRRDTNFRIASTTKPVAAVAAVILVEVCRLRLDEADDALQDRVRAVSRYLMRRPPTPYRRQAVRPP